MADHAPNVPPFPNTTFGGPLRQRVEDVNRGTGSSRITERAANVVEAGARDGRLASALEIEDRTTIASPLGRDLSDLEPLRSSNEFTPQWGSASKERSASAKRPSPLAGGTDRSKARRASPEPLGSTPQDEDMFDPADIHIHSTPESRGSNVIPRSGDSRGRGVSPNTLLRITDDPVSDPRVRGSRYRPLRPSDLIPVENLVIPELRKYLICTFRRGEASSSVVNTFNAFANQIRLLNSLATEIATQADADRMRLIVQRFAGEIIPDSRAVVRHAIDEQSEAVDQRINSLSNEVRESVREVEGGMSQLHQVVQDKRHAMFRSQAAFEDQTNTEIEKFEKRLYSIEKAVRLTASSDAPAAGPLAAILT